MGCFGVVEATANDEGAAVEGEAIEGGDKSGGCAVDKCDGGGVASMAVSAVAVPAWRYDAARNTSEAATRTPSTCVRRSDEVAATRIKGGGIAPALLHAALKAHLIQQKQNCDPN